MGETKFTPGPWEVDEDETLDPRFAVMSARSFEVASVYNVEDGDAEANARLIAAAPALFNACHVALQVCRYDAGEGRKAYDLQFVRETLESALAAAGKEREG